MASSNKTSLGLNQWVESDTPSMSDFNGDNSIINNALVNLDNKIGQGVFLPDPTPGKSQTLTTKATDKTLISLEGRTQVEKTDPAAEVSPDNLATLTGVHNPTITAASADNTQSNTQAITATLYSLPNGVCDEYDGVSGKLTRRVGRLVLDGSEDEGWFAATYVWSTQNIIPAAPPKSTSGHCTHFQAVSGNSSSLVGKNQLGIATSNQQISIGKATFASLEALKTYLTAQKTAGTPVTVLYELAEPVITYEQHDLVCYADQTAISCSDPVLQDSDMAVTVVDGREVFDVTRLGGLTAGTYLQQGEWKPVAYGRTTEGNMVSTVSVAKYSRTGNMVCCALSMTLTGAGGASGEIAIRGIPFSSTGGFSSRASVLGNSGRYIYGYIESLASSTNNTDLIIRQHSDNTLLAVEGIQFPFRINGTFLYITEE